MPLDLQDRHAVLAPQISRIDMQSSALAAASMPWPSCMILWLRCRQTPRIDTQFSALAVANTPWPTCMISWLKCSRVSCSPEAQGDDIAVHLENKQLTICQVPRSSSSVRCLSSSWLHDIQPNHKNSLPATSFADSQPATPKLGFRQRSQLQHNTIQALANFRVWVWETAPVANKFPGG